MTTPAPDAAVQKGVFAALSASADVTAAFVGKGAKQIFDFVPRDAAGKVTKSYPFLGFGASQSVRGAVADCDAETEAFLDVECWDDAVKRGSVGAKNLASAVAIAAGRVLVFEGWTCTEAQVQTIRSLPEVNGVARSIVTLRYLLDPA